MDITDRTTESTDEFLARMVPFFEAEPAEESAVERVALALWRADPEASDRENPMTASSWPPSAAYHRMAEAAISALTERVR